MTAEVVRVEVPEAEDQLGDLAVEASDQPTLLRHHLFSELQHRRTSIRESRTSRRSTCKVRNQIGYGDESNYH